MPDNLPAVQRETEPSLPETSHRPSVYQEDSSVAEVTTAWPSEKPGKQVKLWTMYPCPHCDKVILVTRIFVISTIRFPYHMI